MGDDYSINIEFPSDLSEDNHTNSEDSKYEFQHTDRVKETFDARTSDKNASRLSLSPYIHIISELKVFRSVPSRLEPKGLSDLPLLTIDYAYLFSQDKKTSITTYLFEQFHAANYQKVKLSSWFQKTTILMLSEATNTMDDESTDLIAANTLY